MDLVVTTESRGSSTVVRLAGDIDMNSCGELREVVESLLSAPGDDGGEVVLDLAGVGFLDSSGLGTLVGLQKRANQEHRELVLCRLTPDVGKIFDVTRLHDAFTIRDAPEVQPEA